MVTRRRIGMVAGGLALAWLVPVATHAVGLDAVLPVLLVAGVAALLHGAGTWLDRVVCAMALLFGATVLGGLVISKWPWGLHPVPIAGTAFSVLVLLAAGRPPVRPVPMRAMDRLAVALPAAVAVALVVPFANRDLGARLGILAAGEDLCRHFALFDVIGVVGGYAFLATGPAESFFDSGAAGMVTYPQGAHFAYALLDRFWRSSTVTGPPVAAMDFLIWASVATFGFLVLAVVWGARRVAGPGSSGWTLAPVLTAVAGYMFVSDPLNVLLRGYPNQVLGLALAAILTAVLARPLTRTGEQLCLVGALLVGIAFTYYLYAPWAAAVSLGWMWVYRRRWLRRWGLTAVVALVAASGAAVSPLISLARAGAQLQTQGTALKVDRVLAVVVFVAVAVALVATRRRAPRWYLMLTTTAAALLFAGAILAYQLATVGHAIYYFEKALHLALVVALVNAGALARLVPRLDGPARRGLVLRVAAATAVVAVMAAGSGPTHTYPVGPGPRLAVGRYKSSPQAGRDAVELTRRYPDGGGAVNVDLAHTPYANFLGTLFAVSMQRHYRDGAVWAGLLWPHRATSLADLERQVASSDTRIRFAVSDPRASFLVLDAAHPNRPATGASAPNFGDPAALTNIEAAEYLRTKFPDRVEVVYLR